MHEKQKIITLANSVNHCLKENYEFIKLQAAERTAVVGASIVSGLLIGLLGILFLFCISLAGGFYLSGIMKSNTAGFTIVAGFYFLLGLVFILGSTRLIEIPFRNKIIRKFFS